MMYMSSIYKGYGNCYNDFIFRSIHTIKIKTNAAAIIPIIIPKLLEISIDAATGLLMFMTTPMVVLEYK